MNSIMSVNLYATAMTAYFGMFGATLSTNPDRFWGPNSITKISYWTAPTGSATTIAGWFARAFGLSLLAFTAGRFLGGNKTIFAKQCVAWHVLSLRIIYPLATFVATGRRAPVPVFNVQIWKAQLVVNIILILWGVGCILLGPKTTIKRD